VPASFLSRKNFGHPCNINRLWYHARMIVAKYIVAACCLTMSLRAEQQVQTNSLNMVLVKLGPGECALGSTREQKQWALEQRGNSVWIDKEGKPSTGIVPYPFWMAVTEVTLGQYKAFTTSSGYKSEAEHGNRPLTWNEGKNMWTKKKGRYWANPGFTQRADNAVTCITWTDAKAFTDWLTKREREARHIGRWDQYRLPTEAEWTLACLGTNRTQYTWGDDPALAEQYANIVDATKRPGGKTWSALHADWCDGYPFAAPVAQFKPNKQGLYDMQGNTWEWCENFYYPLEGQRVQAPEFLHHGKYKVLRGGSWDNNSGSCRAAIRRTAGTHFTTDTIGFRVVLVPNDPALMQ